MTADAFDGIDDIAWDSLKHAYGSAEDVPQALRDAVGEDDELAEEALEHLFGSVYHQGTLYPATPWAVPFVARLAVDPGTRRREHLLSLLAVIAATDDATAQVLADVRAALARETRRLLPLLDDPESDIRHVATHLLGNLPCESAAEVVPVLRERYGRESSPLVLAGLLAAAGRLDREGCGAWLAAELAPDRPNAARTGALWAMADAGLPWPDAVPETIASCWLNGEALEEWIWSYDPFGDIVSRLDGPSFAEVCRVLLARGSAAAARNAINAAYHRCVRSRAARTELAPLLLEGIHHPDSTVRVAAAEAIRDVPQAASTAVASLAVYVTAQNPASAPGPGLASDEEAPVADSAWAPGSDRAKLFEAALEVLISLGDRRWREPFMTALVAGRINPNLVGLLIDSGVPSDPALLGAVRRRLAVLSSEGSPRGGGYDGLLRGDQRHNEINELTRLLYHWGPDAAGAVPELTPLIPYDRWWAVRALAAIGPAAEAAVPALTRVRGDVAAPWRLRLECARALATITGDVGRLAACVAEAAADGEPMPAAQTALRHGLPLNGLLPVLRDLVSDRGGDTASGTGARIGAARLLASAGETAAPLRIAAEALDGAPGRRRHVKAAAELAGLIGPAASELVPRLRALLDDPHHFFAAALAIRRVTGEAAPLVDAVRRQLAQLGCGPWLTEPLRELAADAAALSPELRELAHGDTPALRAGVYGRQVREDEEERRRLLSVLAGLEA
ncbi:hypothetical protein ABZ897_53160 [Nonomuraea sp. NPDC046802]|uniref:hypothetical protein n=1 Tax=Nonomuraea sp. NPDC046802 TaxID=3154919 RepID=UPI0033D289CF